MRITFLLAALLLAASAPAAQSGDAGEEAAADAFTALREAFSTLHRSLQGTGGLREEDRPALVALRDRALAFSEANPGNREALAVALQLSIWLEDHERVHALFGRLVELMPDHEGLRLAWVRAAERQEDPARLDAIYEQLLARHPADADLRIAWAQSLKGRHEYARAIDLLRAPGFAAAAHPRAAILLSDGLFAEHRFQEAVEALESVAPEALAESPLPAAQIEQLLPIRRQYVEEWAKEQELRYEEGSRADLPQAELRTARGVIVVALLEDQAPNTVANFIKLAESGFYDLTKFHRVIANFMAQGGDPNSREGATGTAGEGGPGYRIPDEHDREGARLHFTGSLAMANTGTPHSGGSQFYLTVEPTPHLNGKHTVFGRVVEGLDVVRRLKVGDVLESVAVTQKRDHPYEPQTLPQAAAVPPAPTPAPVTIEPATGSDPGGEGPP